MNKTFTDTCFSFFFRGVEVVAHGWIEPADRSVGIMGETFLLEEVIAVDGSRSWTYSGDPNAHADEITDSEMISIESALWDTMNSRDRVYVWSWLDNYTMDWI